MTEFSAIEGAWQAIRGRPWIRVATVYSAIGLGVLGAAELILEPLGLGFARAPIVVVTLAGFPLALILAWAYDVRTARSQPRSAAHVGSKPMVLVLPMLNLSAASQDDYFSDGITEDIIAQLAQLDGLRVISRSSAMRYRNSDRTVKEIAAELGASHVVEGSVRRAANRIRIVTELTEAASHTSLWAQTYDRELTDVFAIQSEVAERIAGALRTRLGSDERRRIARRPTADQEAYNDFLLARHHANQVSADSIERAIGLYQRAIARDAGFAKAWAALAEIQLFHVAGYYGVRPREAAATVTRLASRALELDRDIAEAHSTLGMIAGMIDLDWQADQLRQERALRLGPNLASVRLLYANHLAMIGRYAEAVDEAQHALELDPASEYVHVHANWIRYCTRHLDDALRALEAAEHQFGRRVLPLTRGETLIALGRAEETIDSFRELYDRIPISWNLGHLAWAQAAAGAKEDARKTLRELHQRETQEYVWPLAFALTYAHLGDMERGFDYLNRAFEDRVAWIQWPNAPTFDPFRSDLRFAALTQKITAANQDFLAATRAHSR